MTDKTDRELLELASKAAGIVGVWHERGQCIHVTDCEGMSDIWWRPHEDDGDALRLAAALDIDVFVNSEYGVVQAESICGDYRGEAVLTEDRADDYRHAILRCAAAIGEQMK